jgi:hypothetical protein
MTNNGQADHAGTLYMWLRAVEASGEFDGSVHLEMVRGKIKRIEIRHDLTLPVEDPKTTGLRNAGKRV